MNDNFSNPAGDMPAVAPASPATASSASAPAAAGEVVHRFEFRGTAGEFFRIWIVNISLSLLTLGFYAPWAKVRTKRYFYANTFLDGANFEYHARPVAILLARVFVIIVIFGGALLLSPELYGDPSGLLYSLLLLLFLPWAWVRGMSFNARNSSHRNLRFSFRRAYAFPYVFYALLFSGVGALFLPWLLRGYHRFKARRHHLGKTAFSFAPVSAWSYAAVYGHVLALLLLLTLPIAAVGVFHAPLAPPSVAEDAHLYFYFSLFAYLLLFLLFFRLQAVLFRLFWNNVRGENGAAFRCNFSAWEFARLLFVNFFAVILSLGLLTPWTRVRKMQFLAARMTLAAPAGLLDDIAARRGADESAFGEEFDASEGFDFDVGII